MATSPIYSWPEPDNTDLVKNGALAIRTMGNAIDTTMGTMTPKSTFTAKGSIAAATAASTPANLSVGANGTTLVADSTAATGLKWAASPNFVGCSIYSSTNVSVATGVNTAITCDSEIFDTDNFHSTSSNTSRITIPSGLAGKYQVNATITFAGNAVGIRTFNVSKNGSTYQWAAQTPGTAATNAGGGTFSTIINLAVADYIEIYAFQNSGVSLNVNGNINDISISVAYLGA